MTPMKSLMLRGTRTPEGCLVLANHLSRYPTLKVGKKTVKAHRFVYEAAHGRTEEHILHTCDNSQCFEVTHLYAGDQAQNMRDMYARNRRDIRGEKNPNWRGGISPRYLQGA